MKNGHGFKIAEKAKLRDALLIILMLCIYLSENLSIMSFNQSSVFIYAIEPIMWILTGLIVLFSPRVRVHGKIRLQNFMKWWTAYLAFIYIVIMMAGGLLDGFGKSPYDLSFLGVTKNVFMMGSLIIGREIARAYLINNNVNRAPLLTICIFALFITLLGIPLNRIHTLNENSQLVQYIAEYFLPEFSKNVIAGYLVYIGGPTLSIIYIGITEGFFWLSPILPNLRWITMGLIGTLTPVFSLMFIQYLYTNALKISGKRKEKNENPIGWIATGLVCILIVWFTLGVFPVYPTVIVTGSMKPMINPGDVVLVKKIDVKKVKVGDIVRFKRDDIYIVHRIINIKEEQNQMEYMTKGDNNSVADSQLVSPESIKGEAIFVIPKIGLPSLLLKSKDKIPKKEVEF